MYIEPLSYRTLDEAINLVNKVFLNQNLFEKASWAFRLSLKKSVIAKIVLWVVGVTEVRYWVAIDGDSSKVIGTTGLYSYKKDRNEAYWLGWTCVSSMDRGKGIGSKLVDFSIEKAQLEGKKFLRLYTSTDPTRATARILYQKRGFRLIGEQKRWRSQFKKLYLELELSAAL
ncbi:GNAT family N-acetyltransferase [Chlorogloeopsis sp. ULAP02]|uniref:GNAT family N-acetyltransferase n=1 Tax=Chlorogloeopsis sp. ULAP02 TaxID=3107926 RepID=UPI003137157D